ncbi:MAG: mercury(II) reductase [Cyanobacteria bacterium J069]
MPPLDYDLIILGGSLAAREAAIAARGFQARVALVEPAETEGVLQREWRHQALCQMGRRVEWRSPWGEVKPLAEPPAWAAVCRWADTLATDLAITRSPAEVAAAGVDVILAQGEFFRRPHLGVRAGERTLRSRAYLLAPPSIVPMPTPFASSLSGKLAPVAQSLSDLWPPSGAELPSRIAVWGQGSAALELAQTLHQLGSTVTLLWEAEVQPLDADLSRLLFAALEAEGIDIYPAGALVSVSQSAGEIRLQFEQASVSVEALLNAADPVPNWDGLNLEAANIRLETDGLRVYPTLQAFNARIFACPNPRHARQQAQLALRNALFLPNRYLRPELLPMVIATQPPIASIGLTEAAARDRHGADVVVQTLSFKDNLKAQMQGTTPGLCKLVARRNGRLLGIHLAGLAAEEVLATAALALQENRRVRSLARLPCASVSVSEILRQTAIAWQQQRLAQQPRLQDWLETWQEIRRSRSRWTKL